MSHFPAFLTPVEKVTVETEVKKSKFIATISPVASKKEFLSFYRETAAKYANANHNCFAYIIGGPHSPKDIGSGDDGEPSGTAGMPMLTVLQHNSLGNVAVVVSRYFGGIKLGTGGLARAYSTATKSAFDQATLQKLVHTIRLEASFPFQFESAVRHALSSLEIPIVASQYSDKATIELDVPANLQDELGCRLKDITRGSGKLSLPAPENSV